MYSADSVRSYVKEHWHNECIPKLQEYIKIPNISPFFIEQDKLEEARKLQDSAMDLIHKWVLQQNIKGAKVDVVRVEDRTPVLFIEIEPTQGVDVKKSGTVLLYGHMDKQPPFDGWHDGLAPYEPVLKNGRLYGRGGADDGYSTFAAITAIAALQQQNASHGRLVVLIEACEESGSRDLPFYISHLKERIGTPNLVICLDSGCGNYDQLWVTQSLRGTCVGRLTVEILSEGVHSGDASGVVPDSFRVLRQLLDRVECSKTGKILVDEFYTEIPESIYENTKKSANVLGYKGVVECFPFLDGVGPVQVEEGLDALTELALNRSYRPQLAITGARGLPDAIACGNVLRPKTTLTLSFRLAPNYDAKRAVPLLTSLLCDNPPYGSKVEFISNKCSRGWSAPPLASWLDNILKDASNTYYGKEPMMIGEGGSIAFMGMLGEMFPEAQFFITGVLGPGSNAHGPNEFLDVNFSEKLTCCIAHVLHQHSHAHVEQLLEEVHQRRSVGEVEENYGRYKDGTKL